MVHVELHVARFLIVKNILIFAFLMLACGKPSQVLGPEPPPAIELIPALPADQPLPESLPDFEQTNQIRQGHFHFHLDEARPCPQGMGTFVVGFNPFKWKWMDYTSHMEVRARRMAPALTIGPPPPPISDWLDTTKVYIRSSDITQQVLDNYDGLYKGSLKMRVNGSPTFQFWTYAFWARAISNDESVITSSNWQYIGKIDPRPTVWYKSRLVDVELVDDLTVRLTFEETVGCFQQISIMIWRYFDEWHHDTHGLIQRWLSQYEFLFRSGYVHPIEGEAVWQQPRRWIDERKRYDYVVTADSEEWAEPQSANLPPRYKRRYSFVIGTGEYTNSRDYEDNRGIKTHRGDPFKLMDTRYRLYWKTFLHWGDVENYTAHYTRTGRSESYSQVYIIDLMNGSIDYYQDENQSLEWE